jgi:uncharacterized protein with GYD domain
MPKYLIKASVTPEGAQGMMKEGGTGRREAVEKLAESAGGSLEALYFAFGETDVYSIVDLPDNSAAAALALTVSSSGAIQTNTVVLMTPEEVDEATRKTVEYRPPGA